jgi:hypothetical protein
MKLMNRLGLASIILAVGVSDLSAAETVLFQDAFETDSSANWTVIGDSPTDVPDHNVQFAVDYGALKYVSNGVTNDVPPAPNSGGTIRGLKLVVNSDAIAETAAVSLYPNGQSFSGNYALRADVFMNYPGAAFGTGSEGSTQFGTFGINHTGTRANWHTTETIGDGIWFAMAGEGGAAEDYRSYEWDGISVISRPGFDGGVIGADHNEVVFQERFPGGVFETAGAPGKRWVQVEVLQRDGNIIWKVDGYVIAERLNTSPNTEGNIMIGLMDIFSSIASPAQYSFILFDNVRVVQLDGTVPPAVSIVATDDAAAEPGTDTATFTVTRIAGDNSSALLVNYRVSGSAEEGVDFTGLPGTVTIPAGEDSAAITVTPLDDLKAEPTETIIITVFGANLELRAGTDIRATANLVDNNDTTAVALTSVDLYAYEGIPSDVGVLRLTRIGDIAPSLTVNLNVSGTAVRGTDYQLTTPAVFPAGVDSLSLNIIPMDNNAVDGTRTVTVELAAGNGYTFTPTNFTVNIRDDDGMAPGTVIFSDDFETDTSANWVVNEAHLDSNRATFNWNYAEMGIPSAPHSTGGTTHGLKLEANIGAPTFTGLSVSPAGFGVEGDYRLSFDMWINYNGPLPAGGTGSTMSMSAGVGTTGDIAQFPGTSVQGVLFSVTGEGGSGSDWRAYAATGAPLTIDSGAYAGGSLNNSDPYYAPFGRVAATPEQLALYPEQTGLTPTGGPGLAWHEVVIEKRGTNISWFVDNLRISTISLTNKEISTNIFVGFFDINGTQTGNQDLSFGLVDNLRVEQLESTVTGEILITGVARSGTNIELTFTAPDAMSAFVVEGSATVDGDYQPEANVQFATVSSTGGITTRRATIPITTQNRFFLVRQQ